MSDEREGANDHGSQGVKLKQPLKEKPKAESKDKASGRAGRERERERKGAGRSRSSDTERRGREARRREDYERNRGQRRERGRSEDGRKRKEEGQRGLDEEGDGSGDTECVVCFCTYDNVFKTPKLLSCGHTFCLECLARINVSSPEIKSLTCPVCRELTNLPHGRDLPHLGTNQDIFRKLPPNMQRLQSVRFKRSKGKLVLKKPLAGTHSSSSKPSLTLPSFKKKAPGAPDQHLELAHTQATIVNVGRPPNRVRGRMRQLFRSDQCYYAAVAAIITVAVALMLVGILAFVVVPNAASNRPPPGNNTSQGNGKNSAP